MIESRHLEQGEQSVSPRRGSKRIWTLPLLAFCGVAFLVVAYLCQSAQLVRIQYAVLAQRQEIKTLDAKRADLELAVQELTSLERVERIAVVKLKMVAPEERHVIEVVWNKADTPQSGDEVAIVTEQ